MSLTRNATVAALVASLGVAAVPATSLAATQATSTATHTYHISVNQGALAGGQNTVTANVKVTNPVNSVRRFWSRTTIQNVVRQGVNNGIQKPYNSEGFQCVPVLDGSMNASTARFTCKLRGADVATAVTLTFTAPYATNAG
jgi:hypothetical protein